MERKGIILVAATAIISGMAIFVSKLGLKDFDPVLFTWLRNTIVAVLLLGIIAGAGEWGALKKLVFRDWLRLAAIGSSRERESGERSKSSSFGIGCDWRRSV